MFDALSLIWVHAFGTPAANKWLTVLPVVSDFALLAAFHNVLCEAILVAHKLNPSKDVDSDGSSDREDAELGAPRNAQKAYRKEAGKRSKRYVQWAQRAETLWEMFLYMAAVLPVMVVHYDLFKHGQAQSRPSGSESSDATPGPIFNFCDDARSKAFQAVKILMAMLFEDDHSSWTILRALLGPQRLWPDQFACDARACILRLIGGTWRRLVKRWRQWPWLLCRIVDPRVAMIERRATAAKFLCRESTPPCCLDSFARKLQARIRDVDHMFETKVQRFLMQMLNMCIFTTSYMECMFAGFRAWLARSKKPIRMAFLSAKHLVHQLHKGYTDMTDSDKTRRGRPLWVQKAPRQNGRHIFCGKLVRSSATKIRRTNPNAKMKQEMTASLTEAAKAWDGVGSHIKKEYSKQAKKKNRSARLLQKALFKESYGDDAGSCCGPWDMGDSDWPYSTSNLKAAGYGEKTGFVKTKSTQWGECGKRVMAKRNYPNGQAKKAKPCFRFWPCCKMSISEEKQVAVAALLDVIKSKVVAGLFNSQVMLGFINGATGTRCFAQCVSFSKKPFEAEFIKHKLVGNVDAADSCPYDIEIASGDVCSEIELALELVRQHPKWDIMHLSISRGPSMARVVVTEQRLIDPTEEKAKAAALLASKKAVSLWKKFSTGVPLVAPKRKAKQLQQPPAKRRKRAMSEAMFQACTIVSLQMHY